MSSLILKEERTLIDLLICEELRDYYTDDLLQAWSVWRDKLATKIMKQRMQASHDGTLERLALQETSGMCTLCKKCEKPPYALSPGRSPQLFPVPILPADMKTPSELTHSFQYLLYSLSQTFLSLSLSLSLSWAPDLSASFCQRQNQTHNETMESPKRHEKLMERAWWVSKLLYLLTIMRWTCTTKKPCNISYELGSASA
jgi:hypothetical protein